MEFTEVLKIFLTAMLPVVELRGALPLAIAKGMQPVAALALCTAGNLLPVPFIILFARRLLGWMRLRSSLPAIFLGVVIAGCIMLALSLGVNAVI